MIYSRQRDKAPKGAKRSSKWPAVRRAFLRAHPFCAACGRATKLEVHHIVPFHVDPALELDAANLITLCECEHNGVNCHLLFGHLGSYKSLNPYVVVDAKVWLAKIQGRP